jgi:hypothetical protein
MYDGNNRLVPAAPIELSQHLSGRHMQFQAQARWYQ